MNPLRPTAHAQAFSLVEVLAATALLTILGILVTQMTVGVAAGTRRSLQPVDSSGQARMVFDRLALDLRYMPVRNDLDYLFQAPPGGSDTLRFFNLARALTDSGRDVLDNRNASIIAYRVAKEDPSSADSKLALLRGSRAVYLSGLASDPDYFGLQAAFGTPPPAWFPVSLPGVSMTPTAGFPNGAYDVLAAGVLRASICYFLGADYTPPGLTPGPATTKKAGTLLANPPMRKLNGTDFVDIEKIRALAVGLVIIDTENRKLATAAQLEGLAAEFPDPIDGQMPLDAWPLLRSLNFTTPVFPPVRAAIRGHQRILELPLK
jgi:hypothetical protein